MQLLKTKILFACLFLSAVHLIAQSQNSLEAGDRRLEEKQAGSASGTPSKITASDYGDFLNKRATSSAPQTAQETEDGSWKMVDDSGAPSILRSGSPGNYCYEVIAGKENTPVTFVSYNDVLAYCAWKNFATSTSTFNFNCCVSSCDPELKSNILTFCLASRRAAPNQASGTAAIAGTELDQILEEAVGIIVVGTAGAEGARGPEIGHVEDVSLDRQQRSMSESTSEAPTVSAKTIFARRYLNINADEFKTIAGKSRGLRSQQFSGLIKALTEYQKAENESCEEKRNRLDALEVLTTNYLKTKENDLYVELGKVSPAADEKERSLRRADACTLLRRGINVERFVLEGKAIEHFDPENGFIPRRGVRFRSEDVSEYQSQFAAGMMSSVDRFTLHNGSKFIFKEESSLEELADLNAEQLCFPKGTTKKQANLAGRSSATYKIDHWFEFGLVPRVGFSSLGGEGKERRGHFQELAEGDQLYQEEPIRLSAEELRAVIGDDNAIINNLVHLALGGASDHDLARLHFPKFLIQVNPQKPLLENGEPISRSRAVELALNGALYFEVLHSKKISYVNQQINFRDPLVQRSLANAQLLHFITGELDPNPLNFVYVRDGRGGRRVAVIDGDLSFARDFEFPTYLINTEDPAAIDVELKKIITRKNAGHVRELPTLIDEEMGERILNAHASDIDEVLEGTGLAEEEISATKNRVETLQRYIKLIKETIGYAKWGDETYEAAKKDPAHNYLGYFSKVLEFMQDQYKQQLLCKINILEQSVSLTPAEEVEMQEAAQKLAELESPKPMIEDIIEGLIDQATAGTAGAELERGSRNGRIISTGSKSSTSTLHSFLTTADNIIKQWYRPLQGTQWVSMLIKFFTPSNPEVYTSTLLFNANKSQTLADRKECLAREDLAAVEEKVFSMDSLEESHKLWQGAVRKLFEAEDACSAAIKAYEEESVTRDFFLTKAKEKKESFIPDILWAQVHSAESAAALALNKAKATADQNDWEKAVNKIARAQQAWRALLSQVVVPFTIPLTTWEKNIKIANAVTNYSEFFPYWTKAAEKRFRSVTTSSLEERQHRNVEECRLWHGLAHQTCEMIPLEHRANLLQEIEFQKTSAALQGAGIAVEFLKNKISEIAAFPIIETSLEKGPGWAQSVHIIKIDREKMGELCSYWSDLVEATKEEESSWYAAIPFLEKLPPVSSNYLRHERAWTLQNEQALLASYHYDVEKANTLARLGKLALKSAQTGPSALADDPLAQAEEKLSKARMLCDQTAAKFENTNVAMWRPTFPSLSIRTASSTAPSGLLAYTTRYYVTNVTPMELFLRGINDEGARPVGYSWRTVEDYYLGVECKNPGVECKELLNEMVNGNPDPLKERWDAATQVLSKISLQVDADLALLEEERKQQEN